MRHIGRASVITLTDAGAPTTTHAPPDRSPATSDRLLVIDEQAVVATGLQLALAGNWNVETSTGPTARDVLDHSRRFQPQVALLDVHVGYGLGSGIALIEPLAALGTRVVMLTAERRRAVLAECLEAGAAGWISKNSGIEELDAALCQLAAGGSVIGRTERADALEQLRIERANQLRDQATFAQLTPREALVLGALTEGLSADEIAERHYVAVTTIRSQIRSVLQKLGVRSQLAAVALADAHRELLPDEAQAGGRDRRRSSTGRRGNGQGISTLSA